MSLNGVTRAGVQELLVNELQNRKKFVDQFCRVNKTDLKQTKTSQGNVLSLLIIAEGTNLHSFHWPQQKHYLIQHHEYIIKWESRMGLPPNLYFGQQDFATLLSSIHTPFTALYPSARKTHELCRQRCCQISYWKCVYRMTPPNPQPNSHLWMSNCLFPKHTSNYIWLSQHKSFKSTHPILMLV